ncbi:hypothetical protein GQ457_08G008320 [Hibiscus cannabinus]
MDGGYSANPDNTKQMGGKRKISMRELKAEMAMICEEQNRLREGQREVQRKFQQLESKMPEHFSQLRRIFNAVTTDNR